MSIIKDFEVLVIMIKTVSVSFSSRPLREPKAPDESLLHLLSFAVQWGIIRLGDFNSKGKFNSQSHQASTPGSKVDA
jgi:hypothetical protein